jgi:hypothetical protein
MRGILDSPSAVNDGRCIESAVRNKHNDSAIQCDKSKEIGGLQTVRTVKSDAMTEL